MTTFTISKMILLEEWSKYTGIYGTQDINYIFSSSPKMRLLHIESPAQMQLHLDNIRMLNPEHKCYSLMTLSWWWPLQILLHERVIHTMPHKRQYIQPSSVTCRWNQLHQQNMPLYVSQSAENVTYVISRRNILSC